MIDNKRDNKICIVVMFIFQWRDRHKNYDFIHTIKINNPKVFDTINKDSIIILIKKKNVKK